jgi:creatinine amidohydrolase
MKRKIWWGDFTTREFEGLDPDNTIAVLPVAATEQHGPHLPVSTDSSIMQGMLETVIDLAPADLDIRILPVQCVGKSNEHQHAPGTLTIPVTTLIDHWVELGHSVARAGIRKVVLVNSHGGNEEVMGIVARELRVRARMLAVKTSWMRFGLPTGLYSPVETSYGIHGGDVETSLMLHFQPELVAFDKAENLNRRSGAPKRNLIFSGTLARMPLPGSRATSIQPAQSARRPLQLLPRARRRPGIRPTPFSS